jgi:hypothetical protein
MARRASSTPEAPKGEELVAELTEFPVAIVCASCGRADCAGCYGEETDRPTESGVVLFVPWERPGASVPARLWSTAKASTQGAEAFFAGMPDGPLGPALTFAWVGETLAVGSSIVALGGLLLGSLGLIFPQFLRQALVDPAWQTALARVVAVAWLSFSLLLVAAHLLHGLVLHLVARSALAAAGLPPETPRSLAQGASQGAARLRRALRFGLYAAGWDIATSPLGLVWAFSDGGLGGVAAARVHAFQTPGRAASAMLRGIYRLEGDDAVRVQRRAMAITMVASVIGILLAGVLVILAA